MTSNMKTLRFWFGGIAVAACTVAWFVALRYSDHCLKTGDRLTEAQKIEIAISAVLSSYPPEIVVKTWVEHAGKSVLEEPAPGASPRFYSRHKPDKPISYSGTEDFRQKNVNCCSVIEMIHREYGPPTQLDMLRGGAAFYVNVTYRVRYLNELGSTLEVRYQEDVGITACGQAVRFIGKVL